MVGGEISKMPAPSQETEGRRAPSAWGAWPSLKIRAARRPGKSCRLRELQGASPSSQVPTPPVAATSHHRAAAADPACPCVYLGQCSHAAQVERAELHYKCYAMQCRTLAPSSKVRTVARGGCVGHSNPRLVPNCVDIRFGEAAEIVIGLARETGNLPTKAAKRASG